jgi:hypothetical protein
MRRDALPFTGMNATGVAAPRSIPRDVPSEHARGTVLGPAPADFAHAVQWRLSSGSAAQAATNTTGIRHSREEATVHDVATESPPMCAAGTPETLTNGLSSIASRQAMGRPVCCKALSAARLFTWTHDTQSTNHFRPRFRTVTARPLTSAGGSGFHQRTAAGRKHVGHLPNSLKLLGISLVGLTIFGGS